MSFHEGLPDLRPNEISPPETILEGLIHGVESRYMEALAKRENEPGVVWLTSERLQGVDGLSDEHAMWIRLASDNKLTPDSEQFDVGIVVVDPAEHNPRPVLHDLEDRHFYVRKWAKKDHTGVIYAGNAVEAASDSRSIIKRARVRGLERKLRSYHLHNMGVWTETTNDSNGVVA